jgi:hypothetical protein
LPRHTIGGDLFEVAEPSLARVDAKLLLRFPEQQIVGTFDISGSKRLAIVPLDALAQLEGQFGAVLAPRPAGREIRHDRFHAVLRLVLLVKDEVVEDAHHWHDRRIGCLFED